MGYKIFVFFNNFTQKIRSNNLLNKLLVGLSLIYPIVLIIISWNEILKIDFPAFLKSLLICFLIYCISLIIQFFCWFILIKGNKNNILEDLSIYLSTLLMRRLPGGFWHWVGRSTLYVNPDKEKTANISSGNLIEWSLLIFIGVSAYLLFGHHTWGISLLGVSYLLLLYHLSSINFRKIYLFILPIIIISLYMFCWILGGYILSILGNNLFSDLTLQISQYVSFWSLTGASNTLLFFLPGGLGIREISLSYLLNSYLTLSQIILLALQLRIVFLFSDVILGIIGLIMNRSVNSKKILHRT